MEKKKVEAEKNDKELKRKAKWEEIVKLKKRKVEVENTIVTEKDSLAKEPIGSGTCGNKIREHATKAGAFAIDMVENERALCVQEKT